MRRFGTVRKFFAHTANNNKTPDLWDGQIVRQNGVALRLHRAPTAGAAARRDFSPYAHGRIPDRGRTGRLPGLRS
jgi:hypothetical protein